MLTPFSSAKLMSVVLNTSHFALLFFWPLKHFAEHSYIYKHVFGQPKKEVCHLLLLFIVKIQSQSSHSSSTCQAVYWNLE